MIIRNNTEMPNVSGKHPVKKSEEWMFPRRKNQCQWQKTTREGCPLIRGTSVREKDFTS